MFERLLLYLGLALTVTVIDWLLWFGLLAKFFKRWLGKMSLQYGRVFDDGSPPPFSWLVVVVVPIIEEHIFRGPIWLLQELKLPMAVLIFVCIVSGYLFGLIHKVNEIYFEYHILNLPWMITAHISIFSTAYGLMVIFTHSLWPAILAHALWNASVYLFAKKLSI